MDSPSAITAARLQSFFGAIPVVFWQRVESGFTQAERWVVQFADGSSRFVKIAGGGRTAAWLRAEYQVYSQLDAAFMPRLLGWNDEGRAPFLILEDLSKGYWPPPWQPGQVEAVLKTLSFVHATSLPLPPAAVRIADNGGAWDQVAKDPLPFLSVGACSRAWLDAALPTLLAASKEASLEGDDLVHLDIRSDNVCFIGTRTVFVDWNWTARGNGLLDVAFWAPSLHAEGGPAPEELLPDAPAWAALVSGFIAARAGITALRNAARVREVQLGQLRTALPWAVRALDLPPLDGRLAD